MPGSSTTPGRPYARDSAYDHVAFRVVERVGAQKIPVFAAQWLACAHPYRRFACLLTKVSARLGADAGRYSFIAVDLHHLLLAGFTGAPTIRMRIAPQAHAPDPFNEPPKPKQPDPFDEPPKPEKPDPFGEPKPQPGDRPDPFNEPEPSQPDPFDEPEPQPGDPFREPQPEAEQ